MIPCNEQVFRRKVMSMLTLVTVLRKRPEVSTEEFRRFMAADYGPTYAALPQVREYVQYHLADRAGDDAEDPIDAIVTQGVSA
jgi:hypothetical protein